MHKVSQSASGVLRQISVTRMSRFRLGNSLHLQRLTGWHLPGSVLKCPRHNACLGAVLLKSYIGAIDQGTSSTRFMVFDKSARVVALAQAEHEQIFPRPGWVEHDALEILRRTREVVAEGLAQRGLQAEDLAAIGITNQRETAVVWDRKTGEPIANAIVCQDTRVSQHVARFAP